jgi:hypothetical protein
MADDDKSPLKLNRSRIILLAFGALALVTILASLGSLSGYQQVREVMKPTDGSAPPVSQKSESGGKGVTLAP